MRDDEPIEPSDEKPGTATEAEPSTVGEQTDEAPPKSRRNLIALIVATVLVVVGGGWAGWYWSHHSTTATVSTSTSPTTQSKTTAPETQPATPTVQELQLDMSKNYGDKYMNGELPVGDGKYTTFGPKQGYVYACSQYANNLATQPGGAMTRGPWFSSDGKTWNITKKVNVDGVVYWHGSMTDTVSGSTRTIVSNDLPTSDPTGIFPIQSSDPAYQYDHNPNTITAQSYTFSLPANPTYGTKPNCIGGTVGIMTTGVEIFSAFDAGGRDAGAWEVQDGCQGHPQEQGAYHYHTLSSCIRTRGVHDVIGFALDGFPITGPNVGTNNILTTSDLDECHGIVSSINLDGKSVTMYHYVMTEDFPYSVSCYRGPAIQPPGLQAQQQAQQDGQIPNRQQHP